MAKKSDKKNNVVDLDAFRRAITARLRCTMPDCRHVSVMKWAIHKSVDDLNCPKCVNQSLEIHEDQSP